MRVLIAPQEFKGSLTARQAAETIAAGVRRAVAGVEVDLAPMSDGGAGLVQAMLSTLGGEHVETDVHDPLMRPVGAGWAVLPNSDAVMEMAAASGLVLLRREELDPLRATTYGTGELIAAALERGCRRIIVGVGGSATVDAGAGTMQALGARLLDADGTDLPPGGAALAHLDRIDVSSRDSRLDGVTIVVASDVTNTLCGPQGAAAVFGPQKGASLEDVRLLDVALSRFADVALRDFGVDLRPMPGTGAAGGLGAGLIVIAGASIQPGFDIVAEAVGLAARIEASDFVITGEGRLDGQTAYGKTAAGVARTARERGKPVAVVAGSVREDFDPASGLFDAVVSASPSGTPPEEAMARAREFVADAASKLTVEMMRRYSERR